MNNIIVKEFDDTKIYTFMWNGKPCWIANQVLSIFDYASPKKTIKDCITKEEFEMGLEYDILKGDDLTNFAVTLNVTANNVISKKARAVTIFYEDGLYGFLQYTDKPIGVRFRKWIRREVIPEIRKTGSYSLVKDNFKEDIHFEYC